MIIFYSCAVALVALALLLRGRLARLSSLRLQHVWLIWAALLIQVVVISLLPSHDHTVLAAVHLATYAAAAGFAWANRKVAGAAPIFIGGAANLAAIVANGGTMPASRRALLASGWHPRPGHFANSAVVPHAHLSLLGDVFATPSWLPGHDVFSVGDVLVVVGFVLVVWRNCARDASGGAASQTLSTVLRRVNDALVALDDRVIAACRVVAHDVDDVSISSRSTLASADRRSARSA